jgi:hypothetical protein
MRDFTDKGLAKATTEELRAASADLEEQIRELRDRRLRIWRVIEARHDGPARSEDAQTVTPGFIDADVKVNGEPERKRRRRWFP